MDINNLYNIKRNHDLLYRKKLEEFYTHASEFSNFSNGKFMIEKTTSLNKLSLKGYILETEFCINLKINNIVKYTLNELKEMVSKYENTAQTNLEEIKAGIYLYELIEDMEFIERDKIHDEKEEISEVVPNILKVTKENCEAKYFEIKKELDEKLTAEQVNYAMPIVNEIFTFIMNGYTQIPIDNI
jgi:hypothetical protein